MALGDIVWFNEAMAFQLDGGFEAADDIKVAICDNTTAPSASTASPTLSDFTQVGSGGTYTSGGTSIGDLGTLVTQTSGTMIMDSATNPTWAQDAGNDTDAYWGIIYNDTDGSDRALGYVDLGGPVDMTAGSLTITWHSNGVMRITKA